MHDFTLRDLHGNRISFNSLIGQRTTIVSHAVDPLAELPYYQYLKSLNHRVIMVVSRPNSLLHMMNEAHDLGMETYTDPDMHLISRLKDQWRLRPDADALVRLLRFQVLYSSGKEMASWHQPCADQWKHFLADRAAVKRFMDRFGSWGVKWLQEQDKDDHLPWTGTNWTAHSDPVTTPTGEVDMFLKYYQLMPNHELQQRLKEIDGDHEQAVPVVEGQ